MPRRSHPAATDWARIVGLYKVLTLNAEGPNFTSDGKMAQYRDVIEIKGDDHRVVTSHVLGDDGRWNGFMTAHYRRRA